MDFLTTLLLITLFFAPLAYSICPIASCSNPNSPPIRFPFGLAHQQPENCSFPGFDLYCTAQGLTALSLPHSGEFLVRYISYQTQNIRVYDPKNCLPKRLLDGFDPSGSRFHPELYVNYTFLSCPRNVTDARFAIIDCLSNDTRSVMATSLHNFAGRMANRSCQVIKTLPVPVSWPQNDEFTSTLSDDIWLSWDVPDCRDCEGEGGVCGVQSNNSQQIECFFDSSGKKKGLSRLVILMCQSLEPRLLEISLCACTGT